MNSTTSEPIHSDPVPSEKLFQWTARAAAVSAYLMFALALLQLVTPRTLGRPGWIETLLLVSTMIATLLGLARQIPGAKVLIAGAIIAIVGGVAHGIGAATSIPFGPFVYTDAAGPRVFGTASWAMPAIWLVVVLNARGVARLGLKPWRKTKTYGFWVIGIAAVLVVLFDLGLEVYAAKVERFWLWMPTKFPITWFGMPLINCFGWALVSLLMLAFATPFLINRSSRSRKMPPDYQPLIFWTLALALFGTGAALQQLWSATILCTVTAVISIVFAVRGARW